MAVAVVVVMGVVWVVSQWWFGGSGLGLQWVGCFFWEKRDTHTKRERMKERGRDEIEIKK